MKAAVVAKDFRDPPRYVDFPDPVPQRGEVELEVVAAAMHPFVKELAAGSHWFSPALPFVPGFDGVGRTGDGKLVYFGGLRAPYGSMAQRVAVDKRHVVPLPDGVDPVRMAASVHLALVGWIPLVVIGKIVPGDTVLINGAIGVGAEVAVRLARQAGARVVVRGRAITRMNVLKADAIAPFEGGVEAILKVAPEGVSLIIGRGWCDDNMLAALEKRRSLRFAEFAASTGEYMFEPSARARVTKSLSRLLAFLAESPFPMKVIAVPLRQVQRAWAGEAAADDARPPSFVRPAARPRVHAIGRTRTLVFVP